MAFNLSEALGYDKVLSKMDNQEVELIPLKYLRENDKNFFSVDALQDLKDSIVLHGILQPLLVVPDDELHYRIIAGHRRFAAAKALVEEGYEALREVPCIILPEMSEAMEWAMLIQTNTAARDLTYAEKSESMIRMKKQLIKLKDEGAKITGSLRDILSEQLEISKTEIARMEVIEKNLIPEAKSLLKEGKMSPSAAYAMARTKPECQKEIMDMQLAAIVPSVVTDYAEKRELDWINADCPHPLGWFECEEKRQGRAVQCRAWKTIKSHKDKGHPGKCPGCCAQCEKAPSCKDCCQNMRAAISQKNAAAAREAQAADILRIKNLAKEAFASTPFANIGKVIKPMIDNGQLSLKEIAEYWTDNLQMMLPYDDVDGFDEGHVSSMVYAETVDDVDWPLAAFVAFCDAVDRTPNVLLGYGDLGFGWHAYPDELPANGQRVVIRRTTDNIVRCGEYVYRDGEWYEPGLDDFKMNITGVTHWIECPEV